MCVKFRLQQSGVRLTSAGFRKFSHHRLLHSVSYVQGQVQADVRGVYSGYDDNEQAPIGCSVTNHFSVDKGVIHQ
jgi:hypothetical protein